MAAAAFIAVFAYNKKALSLCAAVTAFIIMTLILICAGAGAELLLIISYIAVMTVDKLFEKGIKAVTSGINKKTGPRDAVQVLSNGLFGTIAVLMYAAFKYPLFLCAYAIGIGEALADSIASDIGVLSKKPPVDICTFKRIEKGMSGGVSPLGISACAVFCCIYAVTAKLLTGISIYGAAFTGALSFAGCIIDSILGSRIQCRYICRICRKPTEKNIHCGEPSEFAGGIRYIDNCRVNLISNGITVILGIAILLWKGYIL